MKTLLLSIILFSFSFLSYSQTSELWGMAAEGGDFNAGVIFKTDLTGTNQSVEHSFFKNVGLTPIYTQLCEASNGKFYGTTRLGGVASDGVLFEYDPATEVYTKKIDFLGDANGKNPEGGLFEASNGLLYGMTSRGGLNDLGVLYSYDPSTNNLINLFDFDGNTGGSNGSLPYGTLIEAPNGKLYGMTSRGGSNNAGVLFEFNPTTGIFVKKVTFTGVNGSRPYGSLMEASDGKFYGTTNLGGTNSLGIIFSYTAGATSVTKEIDFNGTVRGSRPVGDLVEGTNAKLYGTTSAGGANGDGVIYEFRLSNGSFVKKMDFNNAVSGDTPNASLILASNGLLYGMTNRGGANDDGVLYSFDYITNSYTNRLDLDGSLTGNRPSGALLESGGLFYGLTYTGGSMGGGALFEFDPSTDVYTKKVDLEASPSGSNPYGSLMQHSNNKLYGLSRIGGASNDGVIFEYDHATQTYTHLHEFGDILDGQNPRGHLIEAANGKLYGMTDRGGSIGYGVLFEYDLATSTYQKLLDFDGTNGAYPKGSLLEASNGKLYGMTRQGGANDEGVIFEYVIATNTYTLKFSFDNLISGRWPMASFMEASDGLLYGVTENGGTNGRGVLFDFNTTTDTYTKQYEFNTEHSPYGHLVEASNGNLYGLTLSDAASGGGTLFEYIISTSSYSVKYAFDGFPYIGGANPYGSLMEASNGNLYGMTKYGGLYNYGVIFEYNLGTDTYSKQTEFNYTNGSRPEYGYLLEVSMPCTPTASTDVQTACDSLVWSNGVTYYASNNTAKDTVMNAAGCDSIITLDLTINNSTASTDMQTACGSYMWMDGITYYTSNNTAKDTLTNAAGCDSIISLDLTINNSTTSTDVQIACDSYIWMNGVTYYASNNTAKDTIMNAAGCDSIITLDLTINNSSASTDVQIACDSYIWIDGVTYYTSNNTAKDTIMNANGCDSIITLDLTINNSSASTDVQSACDSYMWMDGVTYYASNNTAKDTVMNAAGCDSIITLDLTINNSSASTDVQTACNSYVWMNGVTYFASNNTAKDTLINAAGCDSIITLDLTINNSSTSTDVQTACDSYMWMNGVTYFASNNTAKDTLTNAAGCDSIITLDLTINNSSASTDSRTSCGSSAFEIPNNSIDDNMNAVIDEYLGYQWIDNNYYAATNNTATYTTTNTAGCDSTVTLDLIVLPSFVTTYDVVSTCGSYTWVNGVTYNSSVTPTGFADEVHYYYATNGCDSVMLILDLTINNSSASTDTHVACDSLTWINGTTYYTSNNTATHTVMNAAGCDSIITLDLTVNYASSSTDTHIECDSYTWIDGVTYTSSNNTATYTSTNTIGCDSIVTLDLTINNSSATTDVQTACDSYTWVDGMTYTTSNNSATYTSTNADGCDSVVTLDLTINTINTSTTTNGVTITSDENGAGYVWIDCDNGNIPLPGEINQSFTATTNGNYAVIISKNGCSDTSNCVNISTIGVNENEVNNQILIYPNPSNGIVNIDLGEFQAESVTVYSSRGRIVYFEKEITDSTLQLTIDAPAGIYYIEIKGLDQNYRMKLTRM